MNAPIIDNRLEGPTIGYPSGSVSLIGPNGIDYNSPTYRAGKIGFGNEMYTTPGLRGEWFQENGIFNPDKFAIHFILDTDFNVVNGEAPGYYSIFSWANAESAWRHLIGIYPPPYYFVFFPDTGAGGFYALQGMSWTAHQKVSIFIRYDRAGLNGGSKKIQIYVEGIERAFSNSAYNSLAPSATGMIGVGGLWNVDQFIEAASSAFDAFKLFDYTNHTDEDIAFLRDNEGWQPSPGGRVLMPKINRAKGIVI